MKLILLTAIQEFEADIKNMLKNANVHSYSFQDVKGYKKNTEELASNWFGTEIPETDSIVFYAFVPKTNSSAVFEAVTNFNSHQETLSHIHIAILNIEQSN
ncbi:MAG: hypothetical protein FGM16_03000 [Flavobacterium sp.]|nr:hypothetical protein [Flavobacterium sp.]